MTGGGHGIGMAMGKVLAEAGVKLCVNGTSEERLENAKAQFGESGIEVFAIAFDVLDDKAVDEGISRIEQEFGAVDIWVLLTDDRFYRNCLD